jgi:IMP dehydrogenase
MKEIELGLTFDDVLLVPQYSEIESRSLINLSCDLGKGIVLNCPIVSSNMKNVTGPEMSLAIAESGGLALLHRFYDYDKIPNIIKPLVEKYPYNIGASVGVKEEDYKLVDELVNIGVKIICVDVAHGNSLLCCSMTEYISSKYPYILLISGNVATGDAAKRLYNSGADVIKVGIGSGSICLTRINAATGVPQLTALDSVYKESITSTNSYGTRKFKIISDGGARYPGDVCKALCLSDAVMLGSMLAGSDEAPGDVVTIDDVRYKSYVGSSVLKGKNIEGVSALVKTKGPVKNVITQILEGVRSGVSYQGARNLEQLKEYHQFIRITQAGLVESHSHTVTLTKG